MTDKMPIRLITKDGELEISPESFRRLEIDLGNGATLWVHRPQEVWYLNDELGVEMNIMGGMRIAHFHPSNSNTIIATSLDRKRSRRELP